MNANSCQHFLQNSHHFVFVFSANKSETDFPSKQGGLDLSNASYKEKLKCSLHCLWEIPQSRVYLGSDSSKLSNMMPSFLFGLSEFHWFRFKLKLILYFWNLVIHELYKRKVRRHTTKSSLRDLTQAKAMKILISKSKSKSEPFVHLPTIKALWRCRLLSTTKINWQLAWC